MGPVFESPDGGHTIYARDPGSTERYLYSQSNEKKALIEQLRESKLWGEIHRAAKTNPTLQKALDQCIIIYNLSKDNGNSKT